MPKAKPKKKAGRPSKIDKEATLKICSVLQRGGYIESAAAYAGISKQTLYDWLRKGNKQSRGQYRTFLDAVKKAMASGEVGLLNGIYAAGEKHWTAYAWILERKNPERWGRARAMEEDGALSYEEPEFLKDDDDVESSDVAEAKKALETD